MICMIRSLAAAWLLGTRCADAQREQVTIAVAGSGWLLRTARGLEAHVTQAGGLAGCRYKGESFVSDCFFLAQDANYNPTGGQTENSKHLWSDMKPAETEPLPDGLRLKFGGTVKVISDMQVRYAETIELRADNRLRLLYDFEALSAAEVGGTFQIVLHLPLGSYAGGTISAPNVVEEDVPAEVSRRPLYTAAASDRERFVDFLTPKAEVRFTFRRPVPVGLYDARPWGAQCLTLYSNVLPSGCTSWSDVRRGDRWGWELEMQVGDRGSLPVRKRDQPTAAQPKLVKPTFPQWLKSLAAQPVPPGSTLVLDGVWRLSKIKTLADEPPPDVEEDLGYQMRDFDDSRWRTIEVPGNWYGTSGFRPQKGENYAVGWFRRSVLIPPECRGQRVILHFGAVNHNATVWVNGAKVGEHHGAFTPFECDVTDQVKSGVENVVAVRCVADFFHTSKLPAKAVYQNNEEMDGHAGIWQSVTLTFRPPVRVAKVFVNPRLATSTIEVDCVVWNAAKIPQAVEWWARATDWETETVRGRAGPQRVLLAAGESRFRFSLPLTKPVLWTPEAPHLYELFVVLSQSGKPVDCTRTRFGFREFVAKGRHVLFNGKPFYLFGASPWFIREAMYEPAKFTRQRVKDWLTSLRRSGCNMIRVFMGPPPPFFYEVADELGMMLYPEWAWCGMPNVDFSVFPRQNKRELLEWVARDYNHPSVVMWSLTNETWGKTIVPHLNELYSAVRAFDRSGRPVVTVSGQYGYGKANVDVPVQTDVFDTHTYTGHPDRPLPWPYLRQFVEDYHRGIVEVYGKVDKPVIIGEAVGMGWVGGSTRVPRDHEITVEEYIEICKKEGWAAPFIRVGPLREFVTGGKEFHDSGVRLAHERLAKNIFELFRLCGDMLQGFAAYDEPPPVSGALCQRPVFVCAEPLDHNLFAGGKMRCTAWVINDGAIALSSPKLTVEVREASGKTLHRERKALALAPPSARQALPVAWQLPANLPSQPLHLSLALETGGKVVSENRYDLFVLRKADLISHITCPKRVALYRGGKESALSGILGDLGVQFTDLTDLKRLADCEALIVGAKALAAMSPGECERVGEWIESGGAALCLEQFMPSRLLWFPGYSLIKTHPQNFVDLVAPKHPAFEGLTSRLCWDGWNGNSGMYADVAIAPATVNILAATTQLTGRYRGRIVMVAAEARVGKGYCFFSQLQAVDRYGTDSVATKYVQNLLKHFLTTPTADLAARAQPLAEGGGAVKFERLSPADCVFVDLRPYANMDLRDEVEGDHKGGWTDQGNKDLRNLPAGRQTFFGVPFDVIAPETNGGKACIVLGGKPVPFLPERAEGIKVGRQADRLYFLHSGAWILRDDAVYGRYVVHYEDGATTEIPLVGGQNLADWWHPTDLDGTAVAWSGNAPGREDVGCWVMPWYNPHSAKRIETLDFLSTGKGIPILLALTAWKRQ